MKTNSHKKETPNISTRIFFLLIDNFTPMDYILFGELFALFFFQRFLHFLGTIGTVFFIDLFYAVSDLALM